jgi:hypothetical protein
LSRNAGQIVGGIFRASVRFLSFLERKSRGFLAKNLGTFFAISLKRRKNEMDSFEMMEVSSSHYEHF